MTTRDFQKKSQFQIFFSYFRPHWRLFVMDLACALMISLIDLAFPYISRWCMYELLPQNAYKTFFAVMAVVFAAFALRAVFTYIIGYWGHTFGILVEADIRRDLFAFCSRKGAPLLAMRSTDLTLEEVFLHLTDESYMNRVKIRKTSPKAGTSAKEGESA